MPVAENHLTQAEEHESDESDQGSSTSIDFDPDSEDAFNAVMQIAPDLLRPFCFRHTWPENTSGYRDEVRYNLIAQSKALDIIDLPQAKMTPEQIADLTEEEPELILHVPRIEATRRRTIIEAALARVAREQGQGGSESRRLALELGLMRPNRPNNFKPNVVNANNSKVDTGGNEVRVLKRIDSEILGQRDRENDTDQVPNQEQPVLSPATSAPSQEDSLKPSKSPISDVRSKENKDSSHGINTHSARPGVTSLQSDLPQDLGKSDSRSDTSEIGVSEGSSKSTSRGTENVVGNLQRKFPRLWRSN